MFFGAHAGKKGQAPTKVSHRFPSNHTKTDGSNPADPTETLGTSGHLPADTALLERMVVLVEFLALRAF
jgi:hypothetical protein